MITKKLLFTIAFGLGLSIALISQNIPSYLPTNGLLGWWPFNGNANDESGNGNHGTVNGATLTFDRYGNSSKAFNFNGTNNFINIVNSSIAAFGSQSFTCMTWFKTSATSPTNNSGMFVRYDNCVSNSGWGLGFNSYKILGLEFPSSRVSNDVISSGTFNNNQWHQAIFIRNTAIMKDLLYVNGVLIVQTPFSNINQLSNTGSAFRFGSCAGYQFYSGMLDDIGIWNRALTQQEINELYNAVNCANNTIITPQVNLLLTGNTATFAASTSDASPTYLWQSDFGQGFVTLNNFGKYSGVNTSMLSIANVQLANHNQPIRAISTSGNCVDTSNVANINITDTCINTSIVTIYDTTFVTITDTNYINETIYDTTHISVSDTNYVTVYDTITNYISVTDTLFIDINTVGLNNNSIINTIKVFPNPANSLLNLNFGNYSLLNGYSIKIFNSLSQVVYNQLIIQQAETIDLSTFGGNGIYFLHVLNSQSNTVEIRKIVLQ
jgi:hypothetical protein